MNKQYISASITPEVKEKFRKQAERENRSYSNMLETMIEFYLKNIKKLKR